jgi:hypothetical protein
MQHCPTRVRAKWGNSVDRTGPNPQQPANGGACRSLDEFCPAQRRHDDHRNESERSTAIDRWAQFVLCHIGQRVDTGDVGSRFGQADGG